MHDLDEHVPNHIEFITCRFMYSLKSIKHIFIHSVYTYTYSVYLRSTLSIQMAYQHVLCISFRWYDQTLRHLNDWLLSPWPYWCVRHAHTIICDFSQKSCLFLSEIKKIICETKKIAPCTTILKRLFLPTQKWHTHSAFRSYHNLLIKHMSILCCCVFFFVSSFWELNNFYIWSINGDQ